MGFLRRDDDDAQNAPPAAQDVATADGAPRRRGTSQGRWPASRSPGGSASSG